jgi:endogenous inhibitor of DNA gyrase (YacG/DUF329 family)
MPCPICGEPVREGHGRRYCSVRCRRAAERQAAGERAAAAFLETVDGIATREQVLELLTAAARGGSVLAAKTLLEELRRDGDGTALPTSVIDELAERRK